jgi:hypothetical protein
MCERAWTLRIGGGFILGIFMVEWSWGKSLLCHVRYVGKHVFLS